MSLFSFRRAILLIARTLFFVILYSVANSLAVERGFWRYLLWIISISILFSAL